MKLPEIARVVWNVMRNRTFVTVVWIALCLFSLVVSSVLVRTLREKETYYVSMWSYAMGRLGVFDDEDPLVMEIIKSNTIPFVITDDRLQVEYYHLVPDAVIDNPRLLRERLDENASLNAPIVINSWDGGRHYVFYGESLILRALKYMPLV